MIFLKDGQINDASVKAYVKAITTELMKETKTTLAGRLAIELVVKTIQQEMDGVIAEQNTELNSKRIVLEKLSDQTIEEWETRKKDWIFGLTQKHRQKIRRYGKTKLTESEKRQVIREYNAANTTYGMFKSLARKFDVSESTISRTVNGPVIQKESKQD